MMAPSTCGASSRNKCSECASNRFISLEFFWRPAHHLAYFNGHVQGSAAWPRGGRCAGGEFVCFLGTFHFYDPIPGEEFLRFREDPIRHGCPVLAGPYQLGLSRIGQSLRRYQLARFAQSFVEADHEANVRLNIFLWPSPEGFISVLRAVHHQNVFHLICPFRFSHSVVR